MVSDYSGGVPTARDVLDREDTAATEALGRGTRPRSEHRLSASRF